MLEAEYNKTTVFYENDIKDFYNNTTQKSLNRSLTNYSKDNVLFFPEDRTLMADTDIIEADRLMATIGETSTFISLIENNFNLYDPFILKNKKIGDILESGYMQIVNILYAIKLFPTDNIIVGIEFPETNLHECIRDHFIIAISSMPQVKKIYLATRSERIYELINRNRNKLMRV